MVAKKAKLSVAKKMLFTYLAISKALYWIESIAMVGTGAFDNILALVVNRMVTRDLFIIACVIVSFNLGRYAKNIAVYYGAYYVIIMGLALAQIWVLERFFDTGHGSIFEHITYFQFFVQFTMVFVFIGIFFGIKEYMAKVKKRTEEEDEESSAPMGTREKLAHVAKMEARKFYHGRVMCTEHNLHEIIALFPKGDIEEFDSMWCGGFVYYCCKKSGFEIPVKPTGCSCSLAGCIAWEEWAKADNNIIYAPAGDKGFTSAPGDIVLFDRVFMDKEHDHIGIVIENNDESITVAEGNVNNVSGVMERPKDSHIRAYIRLPDNYM